MARLTLQVDSPSLLEQLKNVLSLMRGVKIVSDSPVSRSAALEDVPNAETLAAMKEAESGHDAGVVRVDSLESFMHQWRNRVYERNSKDLAVQENDKEFVETLMGIVKLLAEGNQIPEEYNPHSLKGNWKNYMECHIENDTLLIWFDKNNNAIELVRLGSHSELFGKGRKR